MSPRVRLRARVVPKNDGMPSERQVVVWLAALAVIVLLLCFVGLLVAVPLAATIDVLVRFALQRYQESSLYTGEKSS